MAKKGTTPDEGNIRVKCSTCNHFVETTDPGEGYGDLIWRCNHAETNEHGGVELCGARNTTKV